MVRWSDDDEKVTDVKFVGAKGKLNYIKDTTIPRSDTCGEFTLSRLAYSADEALQKTELDLMCQTKLLFTGSTTVLAWIKSAAIKYKPYIKNKLIEIQELHPINVWRYIPSTQNRIADTISKGCKSEYLDEIIRGPEILYSSKKYINQLYTFMKCIS